MEQSLEKKYKFDPFKFVENRQYGVPPTQEDFDTFNNFMVAATVSMNRDHLDVIPKVNSLAFSKLSKKHQCLAYTALDGKSFPFKPWLKSSKKEKDVSKEILIKIAKLFSCSLREARMYIEDGYFDLEEALDLYANRYERETLISSKTGNIKKR